MPFFVTHLVQYSVSLITLQMVYKSLYCPDEEPCKHIFFQTYLEIVYVGLELTRCLWDDKLK